MVDVDEDAPTIVWIDGPFGVGKTTVTDGGSTDEVSAAAVLGAAVLAAGGPLDGVG